MEFSFKRKALLSGLGLTLGLAGCESYLDVNVNPNTPTAVPAALVLPNALNRPAVAVGNTLNVLGNLYAGNWAQSADFLFYVPEQTYQLTTTSYESVWSEMYAGSLPDLAAVEASARTAGDKNSVAIARIMQAYDYQILVDAFGDVPFTDALKGVTNLTPKFDKDADVYTGLITLIDDGLSNINTATGASTPGSADIIFQGDMNKWRRFANTLKLRIYLRQSLARPAVAEAGIRGLQGAAFLGVNEQVGVNPGYLNSAGKTNPLVNNVGYTVTGAATSNSQATRANTLGVDYLKATNDTIRLKSIYTQIGGAAATPNISRRYLGIQSGATPAAQAGNQGNLSRIGTGIIKPFASSGFAQPVYLMTAPESFFLQAEAVQKGWLTVTGATAQSLYESGIQESFKLLGLTVAQATTYYSQTSAINPIVADRLVAGGQFDTKAISPNYTLATDKLEAIITQKWIANNGINGFEAWTEYRRTGFPKGNYISLNAAAPNFPVRIPYPQNEVSNNPNTPKGVTIFDPKIFWDVN